MSEQAYCYKCLKVQPCTVASETAGHLCYRWTWTCTVCGSLADEDYDDRNDDEPDADYADDDFDDDDEWDDALDECGMLPPHLGGGCTLGGTEHCDFECPFRDNPALLSDDDS